MNGCRVIACPAGRGPGLCPEHDTPEIAAMRSPHQYVYRGERVVLNSRPWAEFGMATGNTDRLRADDWSAGMLERVGPAAPCAEAAVMGQLALALGISVPAPAPSQPSAVALVEAGTREIGGQTPAPVRAPPPWTPPPISLPPSPEPRPCRDWCGRPECDSKRTYTRNPAVPCLVCAGPAPVCSRWALVCSTVCEDLRLALGADELYRVDILLAARPWLQWHQSLADLDELDERLSLLEYEVGRRQQFLVAVKRWMGRALGVEVLEGRAGTVWLQHDWWPA